jgi:hypothetical protein
VKGSLVLDPCGAEQAQQEAGGTLALMPTANEVAPPVIQPSQTPARPHNFQLADSSLSNIFAAKVGCPDHAGLELRQDMTTFLTCTAQVTGVLLTGGWPGDSAKDALSLALGGCGAVDAVMRETLRSAAAAAAVAKQ